MSDQVQTSSSAAETKRAGDTDEGLDERSSKIQKIENPSASSESKQEPVDGSEPVYDIEDLLPPSSTHRGVWYAREEDVGITQYLREGPGIRGIMKERFTDFLVNEVSEAGDVITLKDIKKPEDVLYQEALSKFNQEEAETIQAMKAPPETNTPQKLQISSDDSRDMTQIGSRLIPRFFTDSGFESLKSLYEQGRNRPTSEKGAKTDKADKNAWKGRGNPRGRDSSDSRVVHSKPLPEKQDRTELHSLIREIFPGCFETSACQIDNEQGDKVSAIGIQWSQSGRRNGGDPQRSEFQKRRRELQTFLPPFIHFTMVKTNRDTQDALSGLGRLLHIQAKEFGICGTKDKRAVTTQRVSIKRNGRTLENFWKNCNDIRSKADELRATTQRALRGVRVGDIAYADQHLDLGMLKGNKFVIVLRHVDLLDDTTLDLAVKSLQKNGFINYYGLQRFSTSVIPTHSVGLALLKGNWKLAVSLIMRPRPDEPPEANVGRRAWEEKQDAITAMSKIEKRNVAEHQLLRYFKAHGPQNHYNALCEIPRNLRTMYTHAYQSYIWNRIASERIAKFGFDKPVVGDLVICGPLADANESEDEETANFEEAGPPISSVVKVLSEEDLDQYSIFDVVLPLPGVDKVYPPNLKSSYSDILRADGLDIESLKRDQRELTLRGGYRKLLQKPLFVACEPMQYNKAEDQLARIEEDVLIGRDLPSSAEHGIPGGPLKALRVELTLSTACYATMALREVLKWDTGPAAQKQLTADIASQLSGTN